MPQYYDVASRGVGLPDYSAPAPLGQVPLGPTYTLTDVAEGVARLGSIDTYDRRGSVVALDGFEEPTLGWGTYATPAASYVRLDNTNCKSGSQSVRLHVTNDATAVAQIEKVLGSLGSARLGIEWHFSRLIGYGCIDLFLERYDGTNYKEASVRVDYGNKKIYIRDASRNLTEVTSFVGLFYGTFMFHPIKLVVDFSTNKYVRLLFADTEYDISNTSIFSELDGSGPCTYLEAYYYAIVNIANSIWLDDFILTQNEPPNTH